MAEAARQPGRSESAGWWLAIGLLSLAGLAVLTVAIADKVSFPFDRPLLSYFHTWDGDPDIWKAGLVTRYGPASSSIRANNPRAAK